MPQRRRITTAAFPRSLIPAVALERRNCSISLARRCFRIGEHKWVAIKVIDPLGNEVMRVHNLNASVP